MIKQGRKRIFIIVIIVCYFIILEVSRLLHLSIFQTHLLPSSYTVIYNTFITLSSTKIYIDIFMSLFRVTLGFLIAASVAISLGILSQYSSTVKLNMEVFTDIIRPIPNIIWLPILIIVFPSYEITIITLPLISAFAPIYLSTLKGLSSVDKYLLINAKFYGLNQYETIFKILIPGSFKHIQNGLQIGISNSWLALVVAEMSSGKDGIGYYSWKSYQSLDYTDMLTGMLIIILLSYISSKTILLCTNKLYRGLF